MAFGYQADQRERRTECGWSGGTGVSCRARRGTRRSRSLTASWASTARWKRMAGLLSKTTVVPVATGVRLEIDTSCVSCGAQAPGNADLLDTVRQRKRAPAPMPSRYQGSFDRLALCRCRPRTLRCEAVAAVNTTEEREASSQLRCRERPRRQRKSWHAAVRRIYDASRMDRSNGPPENATTAPNWRGRW